MEMACRVQPCVGDGVAFAELLQNAPAHRYGIEIDADRTEQAQSLDIGGRKWTCVTAEDFGRPALVGDNLRSG